MLVSVLKPFKSDRENNLSLSNKIESLGVYFLAYKANKTGCLMLFLKQGRVLSRSYSPAIDLSLILIGTGR